MTEKQLRAIEGHAEIGGSLPRAMARELIAEIRRLWAERDEKLADLEARVKQLERGRT